MTPGSETLAESDPQRRGKTYPVGAGYYGLELDAV